MENIDTGYKSIETFTKELHAHPPRPPASWIPYLCLTNRCFYQLLDSTLYEDSALRFQQYNLTLLPCIRLAASSLTSSDLKNINTLSYQDELLGEMFTKADKEIIDTLSKALGLRQKFTKTQLDSHESTFAELLTFCKSLSTIDNKKNILTWLIQANEYFAHIIKSQSDIELEGFLLPSLLERVTDFNEILTPVLSVATSLWSPCLDELDSLLNYEAENTTYYSNLKDVCNPAKVEIMLTIANKSLENQTAAIGFVWAVGKHRLIGTCHDMPYQLVNKSKTLSEAQAAQTLYVESKEVMEFMDSTVSTNNIMDISLLKAAKARKAEVISLESFTNHMNNVQKLSHSHLVGMMLSNAQKYQSQRAWQVGNEELAEQLLNSSDANFKDHIIDVRTNNWVIDHHLIETLQLSEKPICIAAGMLHFLGKNGLIRIFSEAGLEPKRIF